jgi:thiol-disulfide isomerase/thioredoxin
MYCATSVVVGQNDNDQDLQSTLAKNVNERLEKTMKDLQERHQNGTNEVDDPDRAPTGPAYRAMAAMQQQQQQAAIMQNSSKQKHQLEQQQKDAEVFRLDRLRQQVDRDLNIQNDNDNEDNNDDNDDDEYDDLLSDPVLDALRERRIQELKLEHAQKQSDLARGHGQYRTITQDEFLPETCTHSTSEFVAVHFYEETFQKCKLLDQHLHHIASCHFRCKFLRIAACKAPFFCTKLQIRTLPTLLVFDKNGKVVDRLTGFEGIQPDLQRHHQTTTTTTSSLGSYSKRLNEKNHDNLDELDVNKLLAWLANTGAIEYKPVSLRSKETKMIGVYRSRLSGEYNDDI